MTKIDKKRIKNMNVKGCVICQNPRLSEIIDPILFEAETNVKDLKDILEDQHFIYLDTSQIATHVKHIFYEEKDSTNEVEKLVEKVKQSKNPDMIAEAIAYIQFKKYKLIEYGRDDSRDFNNLQKLESELLNLKAKVDGDLVEKVEVSVPEWIKCKKEE